jgi:preprotein translocase subunit SecA
MQTQISDDSPLESEFLSKSLDSAQERVEERAYQQRKIYSIMMMSNNEILFTTKEDKF